MHVRVGSVAYGVSAGDGEVHLTLRTVDNAGLAALQQQITELAESLATRERLRLRIEVVEEFYANMNDPDVTRRVMSAARQCGFEVITPEVGMRAGEDFGLFSERFPCCMVLLGAGEHSHPIHNPHYDFADELIGTGVQLYDRIVRDALGGC